MGVFIITVFLFIAPSLRGRTKSFLYELHIGTNTVRSSGIEPVTTQTDNRIINYLVIINVR